MAGLEGRGGKDYQFMGRVDAVYVKGRIRFGIAFFTGIFKRLVIRVFLERHLRQDIIRCPVDDSVKGLHLVARQTIPDGSQNGDQKRELQAI